MARRGLRRWHSGSAFAGRMDTPPPSAQARSKPRRPWAWSPRGCSGFLPLLTSRATLFPLPCCGWRLRQLATCMEARPWPSRGAAAGSAASSDPRASPVSWLRTRLRITRAALPRGGPAGLRTQISQPPARAVLCVCAGGPERRAAPQPSAPAAGTAWPGRTPWQSFWPRGARASPIPTRDPHIKDFGVTRDPAPVVDARFVNCLNRGTLVWDVMRSLLRGQIRAGSFEGQVGAPQRHWGWARGELDASWRCTDCWQMSLSAQSPKETERRIENPGKKRHRRPTWIRDHRLDFKKRCRHVCDDCPTHAPRGHHDYVPLRQLCVHPLEPARRPAPGPM